jgi:hypothetical protein
MPRRRCRNNGGTATARNTQSMSLLREGEGRELAGWGARGITEEHVGGGRSGPSGLGGAFPAVIARALGGGKLGRGPGWMDKGGDKKRARNGDAMDMLGSRAGNGQAQSPLWHGK